MAPVYVAMPGRRLPENHLEGRVAGLVREEWIGHFEPMIPARFSDDRVEAALALADRGELVQAGDVDGENVALLRLVRPDLHRRHPRLLDGDLAQVEARADPTRVRELRERVGKPARADVVDREDRVLLAHLPAGVNHFLATSLELGVV